MTSNYIYNGPLVLILTRSHLLLPASDLFGHAPEPPQISSKLHFPVVPSSSPTFHDRVSLSGSRWSRLFPQKIAVTLPRSLSSSYHTDHTTLNHIPKPPLDVCLTQYPLPHAIIRVGRLYPRAPQISIQLVPNGAHDVESHF
jgi:hypothetical protein